MLSPYQTFPIHRATYKGTATDEAVKSQRLIKALADGTITFTFDNDETLEITVSEGFDCYMNTDVVSVTSTATVLMS